jgi:hypothetical protein
MYYAYARLLKKWALQWQAYMKKNVILHAKKDIIAKLVNSLYLML